MNYTFETFENRFSVDIDYLLDDKETYNVFVYHEKGIDNLDMPLDQFENLIKGRWLVWPNRKVVFTHFTDPVDMKHSFYNKLSEYENSYSNLRYAKNTYKRFNRTIIILTIFIIFTVINTYFFRSNVAFYSSLFITMSVLACALAPSFFLRKFE